MNGKSTTVIVDGISWRMFAGELWANYDTSAAYMDCSPGTVCNKVYQGLLRPIRLGKRKHLSKNQIDALILRDAE
jgi:hypothetical protein